MVNRVLLFPTVNTFFICYNSKFVKFFFCNNNSVRKLEVKFFHFIFLADIMNGIKNVTLHFFAAKLRVVSQRTLGTSMLVVICMFYCIS